MMADTLDAAIRNALSLYAQSQELGQQDEEEGNAECSPDSRNGHSQADSTVASVKKTKMLRVARMLVDSNPRIRNKGMASVGSFLDRFQELKENELLHVWSTLYYAAWLSDKPLVQRDFFVRASLLHRRLRCPRAKTLFFCSFFRVLIAEWGKLDRHRTNKFLLFCRIFLAEWIHVMRLMKWEETFVKAAVEFLCEEVMLCANARGVALHIVDVLTDEFRVLLDPAVHPSSASGRQDIASSPEQEERLLAFSWLFVPLLRCCCFSMDAALVARIHERSLQTLGPQDVDLHFVTTTLFALASDKRVRSENRKRLFASHEHVKEEATRAFSERGESVDRYIGSFTEASFARLMVQRVLSSSAAQQQKFQQRYDPLKEFPSQRKRAASPDGDGDVADAHPAPVGTTSTDSPALPREKKRAKKRKRLQQPEQELEALSSESLAVEETPRGSAAQKPSKNKIRKMQPSIRKESDATYTSLSLSTSGLRLPIKTSGVKAVRCAGSSSSSTLTGNDISSASEESKGASSSPVDKQKKEHIQPSGSEAAGGECTSPSPQEPPVSTQLKAPQNEEPPPRRRSLRISEANPNSKRVLFNLKKNKVVAFSRHAPSLAVGPASPPIVKGVSRSTPLDGVAPSGSCSPEILPRGILRAAKQLGPPKGEETVLMPPIKKSQGPPWLDGATAELMTFLRRALARHMNSVNDKANEKQKKRKIRLKEMKRAAKTK